MLVNTAVTIAYKCPACGSFEFISATLFSLAQGERGTFSCRCGSSSVSFHTNGRELSIKVPCFGCGEEHEYVITRKELLHKNINTLYCPDTGLPQCFTGNDKCVRNRVDSLEKEFEELIDTFGYDNYFVNSRVMLDILNRIHDLASEGNLHCECGSSDIELNLFSDRIQLQCRKCSAGKIIKAATNSDLKEVLARHQIMLLCDMDKRDAGNGDHYNRKSDDK